VGRDKAALSSGCEPHWLYETLGLFNGYRAVRLAPKVAPAG
jgi:hypothetical protein